MPEGLAYLEAVRALRECPHLKIEIWGTRFCGFNEMWATLPLEVASDEQQIPFGDDKQEKQRQRS